MVTVASRLLSPALSGPRDAKQVLLILPSCNTFFFSSLSSQDSSDPSFLTNLMSASPTTFYVPTLERPSPTASWESRRSPASSFSKGPRPTGDAFDLRRSSLSSTSSSLPPPYIREHSDEESIIPAYGEEQEVKTMARSLFFYGFREWQISPP